MMDILFYNCSNDIINFIKRCLKKELNFSVDYSILESLDKNVYYSAHALLIVEIDDDLDVKSIYGSMRGINGTKIMALFKKVDLALIKASINSNLFDYIDFLPLNSTTSFVKAINEVINSTNFLSNDERYIDMLVMEYIYSLIYGDISRIKKINRFTYLLNLKKIPNIVFTLMVDDFWDICLNLNNKQRYYIKRTVLNLVKKAIARYPAVTCSLIGTDKIIILLDLSDGIDNIMNMAKHIKDYIKENSKYTITIGISGVHTDYKNLWKAYEESFQAINYSYRIGNNVIIEYKNISVLKIDNYNNYDSIHYEYQLFKNLGSSIEIILEFYDILFNSFVNKKFDRDMIKSIMNKLIYEILQYYFELGLNQRYISFLATETTIQIFRASSITTIREIGKKFLDKVTEKAIELTRNNIDLSLEASMIFINKYYYKDITLRDVSIISNMSSSYYSRKFKERYGVCFINYLLKIRLEKAKELISESCLSIREVTERVGFNDTSYFSRCFKKRYGIPPSHYKLKK